MPDSIGGKRPVRGSNLSMPVSFGRQRRAVTLPDMHALTNLEIPSRRYALYNKRGRRWIKEGKQPVKMTRLSCHRFSSNQVRLALSLVACRAED